MSWERASKQTFRCFVLHYIQFLPISTIRMFNYEILNARIQLVADNFENNFLYLIE